MPAKLIDDPEGAEWRSRDFAPSASRPVRTDLVAGFSVVAALAQALLVPVTLLLVIAFVVVCRLSRWRPAWLVLPAAGGLAWTLAVGFRPALAGYLAGAGHLVAHLARAWTPAARLALARGLLAGWRARLAAQVPAALLVAAGEAALIGSLGRRGAVRPGSPGSASRSARNYRHDASEHAPANRSRWDYPYRPGAVITARRWYLAWSTGRGELATADGGCLGISWSTGRRAAISWREATGGVLCTGRNAATVTETGLTLALAAITHRKTVLVIDLVGSNGYASGGKVADAIETCCANAGAPLRRFGGPSGCYDALSPARARAAELVLAMIDWTGLDPTTQRFCADYVSAALAVSAAAGPAGPAGPAVSVLDELARLLTPETLRARAVERTGQPGPLAQQLADLAGRLGAEPAAVAPVAAQLQALRSGSLGRWLRPPAGDPGISLRRALAGREVILFSLDRAVLGRSAAMIARLAIADLTASLAGRGEPGAPADCLAWVNGCEAIAPHQLTTLIGCGASCGTAVVLGTAADQAATALAGQVKVVAIRGEVPLSSRWAQAPPPFGPPGPAPGQAPDLDPPAWAPTGPAGLAERAWLEMKDDASLPARLLARRPDDALSLLVRGPRPRLHSDCLAAR